MNRWTAWKAGVALALLGAAGGAIYAHHVASRPIPVALRAVDSPPPVRTKFQRCAQIIDPGDCGYPSTSSSPDVGVKQEGGTMFVEFQRGDPASLELARNLIKREFQNNFTKPSPLLPINGALAGFVFGFAGYLTFLKLCASPSS